MTIRPGEEFRLSATPSPELMRKLAYLAQQDSGAVQTGGIRTGQNSRLGRTGKSGTSTDLADFLARQQMMRARLDEADRASALARQQIDLEITENRRRLQDMLDRAYRDEQGRRIFMGRDGKSAYYEDGTRVDEAEFARLPREQLEQRPRWEDYRDQREAERRLQEEREAIERHDRLRREWRERLERGDITPQELEKMERELESSMPERLRRKQAETTPAKADERDFTLSDKELASLGPPRTSVAAEVLGTREFPGAPSLNTAFASTKTTDTATAGDAPQQRTTVPVPPGFKP